MDARRSARGPRAAYLHIPFCRHRCGYCNFTVVAGRDELADTYLNALELEMRSLEFARPLETVFIGGGTPTHLSPSQLDRLLSLVHRWFLLEPDGEWTVEANPEDFAEQGPRTGDAKMQLLRQAGVTRLSLGAQSFDDAKLHRLERSHDAARIRAVVAAAREWFPSLSVDLIFAAPFESARTWRHDLEQTISLDPHHVSTYGLTIEKGTTFFNRHERGALCEVDEELQRTMYLQAITRLSEAGYEHYEVSNFARPGHRSRHNEAYWSGAEYFAFGAGAARYLGGIRETNHRSTTTYLKRVLAGESPVAESEQLNDELQARERLVFGLRRLEGVETGWFRAQTGFDLRELAGREIDPLVRMGLLQWSGPCLRLTREGLLVSDSLWPHLIVP